MKPDVTRPVQMNLDFPRTCEDIARAWDGLCRSGRDKLRYKLTLGKLLWDLKQQVAHGEFLNSIKNHFPQIPRRDACRLVAGYLAQKDVSPGDVGRLNYEETEKAESKWANLPIWKEPGAEPDEETTSDESDENDHCEEGNGIGQSEADSEDEEKESDNPFHDPQKPSPPDLEPVLSKAPKFEALAKSARSLSKKLWGLEQSEAWKTLASWERALGGGARFTKRSISALVTALAHELEQMTPAGLCKDCDGIPAGDAAETFCPTCKGRGYLLACEVKKDEKP